MEKLVLGLVWYIIFILSTVCHEVAHGLTARKFGDHTAEHHGLLTLDPVPHIQRSPFGMLLVPLLSFAMAGWMIGWASCPYDPYWASANRKKEALMAISGPLTNLALVILAALLVRIGILANVFTAPDIATLTHITEAKSQGFFSAAVTAISILFSLNLLLFIFNLLPFPPLDGSSLPYLFLKPAQIIKYESFVSNPTFHFIGIIIAWHIIGYIHSPVRTLALNILYPGAGYH
jgi:Zn-dependent protease